MIKNMSELIELNSCQHRAMMLDILDDIHRFCDKHSLRYYLYYGSLLGAVRHRGYIPWDDDIDIVMPRPDYDAFLNQYQSAQYECLSILSQNDYPLEFAKVHNPETLVVEDSPEETTWGVSVDIFPLDGIPDAESGAKLSKRVSTLRGWVANQRFTRKMRLSETKSLFKKAKILVGRFFHPFLSLNGLLRKEDEAMARYSYRDSDFVSCLADIRPVFLPKVLFEETVSLPFEDREYVAPAGYDQILRALYGDYMTPPEEKYRISNHGAKVYFKCK